jgi:hypothetical protein
LKSGTAALLAAEDDRYFQVSSTTSRPRVASWYGSFAGVPKGLGNLRITYVGKNSRACAQTVAIWRWSDSTWVQLDARTVGAARVTLADLVPPGASGDYVGGTSGGEVRVRVRCTDPKSSFVSSGDLMKIDYDSP